MTIASAPVIRNRASQAGAVAGTIALGLLSSSHYLHLPHFWSKYAGDSLWALMVFFLAGILLQRASTRTVAIAAMVYSCITEFSQLTHTPWLDAVRRTVLGHLILGDTFAWADIAAYGVGVILGALFEAAMYRRLRPAARETARQQ